MHLTLFFLGETERIGAVKEALATVQAAPVDLALVGAGTFPPGHRQPPRVLWAGVELPPALTTLHQQVTTVLTGIGFQAEERPFRPHITLARFREGASRPVVDAFVSDHRDLRLTAALSEFVLFSSVLRPDGARYTREAVYPLRA